MHTTALRRTLTKAIKNYRSPLLAERSLGQCHRTTLPLPSSRGANTLQPGQYKAISPQGANLSSGCPVAIDQLLLHSEKLVLFAMHCAIGSCCATCIRCQQTLHLSTRPSPVKDSRLQSSKTGMALLGCLDADMGNRSSGGAYNDARRQPETTLPLCRPLKAESCVHLSQAPVAIGMCMMCMCNRHVHERTMSSAG
jgi:hypothetical protein